MAKLIVMGPQGCGKGTHSAIIAKRYGIPTISTGDLFRDNIAQGTSLGLLAKSFIDKGELVPDQITVDLLNERLENKDCKNGFILDGFPRTINQAKLLDTSMEENKEEIDLVLFFDLPVEESKKRMQGRVTCADCKQIYSRSNYSEDLCEKCGGMLFVRDDDKEEAIEKRLKNFEKQTLPVKHYYEKQGKVVSIDMMGSVEENRLKISAKLDEFDKKLAAKNIKQPEKGMGI